MRIHQFHTTHQVRLSKATKPFTARGAKIKRCPYCQIEQPLCLCQYQPDIDCDARFILLVSDTEIFKPSNTGRLIADTIKQTDVFLWSRTEPDQRLLSIINDPSLQPIVVFPAEYVEQPERIIPSSIGLNKEKCKQPVFILFDGSWREARRMFRRSPYLDDCPVLSIHPEQISQYLMRKSDNETHLSTAEVSCLVLEQAGYLDASVVLEYWFKAFRESYLISKWRMRRDQQRPHLKRYLALSGMSSQCTIE